MDDDERKATEAGKPRAPFWERVVPLALVALIIAFVLHVAHLASVSGDAYVVFRLARHLAGGAGMVWDVGASSGGEGIAGSSSALWTVVLATATRFGLSPELVARVIGTCFGVATLLLLYRIGRRVLLWSAGAALVPPALLAVCGPFAAAAGSGTETVLFAYLVLQAAYLLAAYWRTEARWPLLLSHLTLVVATLTRMDGLVVWGVFCIAGLITPTHSVRVAARRLVVPIGVYGLLVALYFGWRLDAFASVFPSPSETHGLVGQVGRGISQLAALALAFVLPLVPLVVLGVWGRSASLLDSRIPGLRRYLEPLRHQPVAAVAGLVTLLYAAYLAAVGGDTAPMQRAFVPVLPMLYLLAGHALRPRSSMAVSLGTPERPGRGRWIACAVVIALCGTLIHSTPIGGVVPSLGAATGNYDGIVDQRARVARQLRIGTWIEKRRGDDDRAIAAPTDALGPIGFATRVPVYDLSAAPQAALRKAPRLLIVDDQFTFDPDPDAALRAVPADLQAAALAAYEAKSAELTGSDQEPLWLNYLERR